MTPISLTRIVELAESATPGDWGVEDPMGPECLSVVANPKAEVYDWLFVANLTMPDEDDHDFTSADVKANAEYVAACKPETILAMAKAIKIAKELFDCELDGHEPDKDSYCYLCRCLGVLHEALAPFGGE